MGDALSLDGTAFAQCPLVRAQDTTFGGTVSGSANVVSRNDGIGGPFDLTGPVGLNRRPGWLPWPMSHAVLDVHPLGFPWRTFDPFLFCVHHLDAYPRGNGRLGPLAPLDGRDLGQDFEGKDGWSMYHGRSVPGFPQHPHRGFETVTIVRQGLVDHSDSLGAAARYGGGDVQWLTAGGGVVHAEMFPLVHREQTNPLDLFQIWLNLPRADKLAAPHFSMLWSHTLPRLPVGVGVEVTLIAGALGEVAPPKPPPSSWASRPESDLAIWTLRLGAEARWRLPPARAGTTRALYVFAGAGVSVDGRALAVGEVARLEGSATPELVNGALAGEALLLQGRPLGEPVVAHGPFVMSSTAELQQAFDDYRRTGFGGWPWPDDAPTHGETPGRFARHVDGRVERPSTPAEPEASAR